ncbi:MAG: Fe-S protein assembly co-chaperone HscB [Sedimenticola sp.]|uniref:Co-chaperone protein HscB homolog n=1 Tax=Sedimenticola thiotaurini TaxID=1543721 RepID=A0A558D8R8_9GAMM|nr:Fe-S protein assembly co-chaperone HscB [Sedimenticola sp.]TVT57346.1 MAG: Fe-S protein assembly co-chaperone HscB [Sedimenticola thiotaurini]MCW8947618.1 Fe-S protein assembly co-chaperone HscB [Sedimenticola sp.]MCW8949715.1 Fe-S protein assembly co-chaperone HscB [Sedimenticola sp.]MCW8974488.1 Fe-S protein assembly co-chaperone HscB [Sedimenticola sp.]
MLDFSKNYFELFGLPVGYIVDANQLATHYRELQKSVHPDRFANATEQERRLSMQGSVLINEAHETLKDPIMRARYLLKLNGIDMDDRQDTTHDAVFLMEQLELREELEDARKKPDPYAVISDLMAEVNRRINTLIGQMALQFEAATPEQLSAARENLFKMQFLKKLRFDAESIEAELDDAL